jgi:flagellar biosynthesis GTPase FlhF
MKISRLLPIILVLVAVGPTHAQPLYPNNPVGVLGAVLNGLSAGIARQQAITAAQQAWSAVDPAMYQCLMRTVSPPPPAWANNGNMPSDPRLRPYFQRCAAEIAQAGAQREAAARLAVEEQQREQAEQAAQDQRQKEQQAEQKREAAEQQQQKLAAEKARRAQEQARIAEQKKQVVTFAQMQNMPELSFYMTDPDPDLVFLYVASSRRLVRGLDGNLTPSGPGRPNVCWVFPTTGASSTGFFLDAMANLEKVAGVKQFDLNACGNLPDSLQNTDVVVFTTTDLTLSNAEQGVALGHAIASKELVRLFEARQSDFDAKLVAQKRLAEQVAEQTHQLAEQIGEKIDGGKQHGVSVLALHPDWNDQDTCITPEVDRDSLVKVLSSRKNGEKIAAAVRYAQLLSVDKEYIGIKTKQCDVVIGSAASLRQIRTALRRDGLDVGAALAWVDPSDMAQAKTELAQEQAANQRAQAEAVAAAAKQAAEDQARRDAEAAAAAKQAAEAQAKEAEAAEAAKQATAAQEAEAEQACSYDFTQCQDLSIACKSDDLTVQVKPLLEQMESPLLGHIKVLNMWDYKRNPAYATSGDGNGDDVSAIISNAMADRTNQCMASMVTDRGEMTAYYGWKHIHGDVYISVRAVPNNGGN